MSIRPATLDLDTLLYVRESMVGIEAVGGTVNPIPLIDSILRVRAEVLGLDADLDAALEDAGSGISEDERWRRIDERLAARRQMHHEVNDTPIGPKHRVVDASGNEEAVQG